MRIIPSEQHRTSNWSGGTTTELFIYPEGSSYSERDFLFRISTASIEIPESEFTLLQGTDRYLMALSGTIELHHEGHYSKVLEPYQWDHFSGEWKTRSLGMGRDFNLMLRKSCSGKIEAIHTHAGQKNEFSAIPGKGYVSVFYLWQGKIKHINDIDFLEEGDVLILDKEQDTPIPFLAINNACIIRADIHVKE